MKLQYALQVTPAGIHMVTQNFNNPERKTKITTSNRARTHSMTSNTETYLISSAVGC